MKAMQFQKYGGPDVLGLIDTEIPFIGEKEVLIEVKAIGVNYADTARREGQYVVPTPLPFIPGAEVAGVVSKVGEGVTGVEIGKRVVTLIEKGGYAEYVVAPAKGLIPIPDGVDYEQAVALPLQGLTAYHTLKTMGRIKQGESVLIHAAAGGVGLLAVQLARLFGAKEVIATASNDAKLALAKDMGADHLVNYTKDGWEDDIRSITDGKGVDVALEMVGGEIFHKTLDCLAAFGRLVIYGAASGEQTTFYPSNLMRRNQSVIGFFLPQIMKQPELLESSLEELLGYVNYGELELKVWGSYPLTDAALVHQLLQGRETTGKVILVP
ncbi:MAG TPA: quinone oxidoreductase [Candidatus Avamphibacillus sp.]|nr:quinone oxidoreductase [Candidatus Avamphibacillus sp.]